MKVEFYELVLVCWCLRLGRKSPKTSRKYKFFPVEIGGHDVRVAQPIKRIFEKPHPIADPFRGSGETHFSDVLKEVEWSFKLERERESRSVAFCEIRLL